MSRCVVDFNQKQIRILEESILYLFDNQYSSMLKKNRNKSIGIFKRLHNSLLETNVFNPKERDIFCSYFLYSTVHPRETLTSLSKKHNLSLERIRVIGEKLQIKLPTLFKELQIPKYLQNKCFNGNYFVITPEFTEMINSTEGVNFSNSLINLFLSSLPNTGYSFYQLYNKKYELKGIFISDKLEFNFDKCFNQLLKVNDSKRSTDKQIKISVLLNKYSFYEESLNITKLQLVEILKLFSEQLSNDSNIIEVTSDVIVFRRNTPKFLKEYLIEILRENKKPMHFRTLFQTLKNKGVVHTTISSVHSTIHDYPEIFGQKGFGCFGLKEWGGYFGFIGDVATQYLLEKGQAVNYKDLENFLCKELNTNEDSVKTILFHIKKEKRFVKIDNVRIGLRIWQKNNKKFHNS